MTLLFILILGLLTIIPIVWISVYWGISPMPSSKKTAAAIGSLIPRDFKGKIYDLGSGFGSLAHYLALHFPDAEIRGYEVSFIPWLISKVFFRKKNLQLIKKNFFTIDFLEAEYVVCYLCPSLMQRISKYPFHKLISHTFSFYGKEAKREIEVDDLWKTKIYFYDDTL